MQTEELMGGCRVPHRVRATGGQGEVQGQRQGQGHVRIRVMSGQIQAQGQLEVQARVMSGQIQGQAQAQVRVMSGSGCGRVCQVARPGLSRPRLSLSTAAALRREQ